MSKTSIVDLKLTAQTSNTETANQKPPVLVSQKRYGCYFIPEIITESIAVEPDGFSSVEFRNIGSCDAVLMDIVPLRINDAPVILKTDLFAKIIQRIKVNFKGSNTDRQVLIIKTYVDELQ